LDNSKHYWVSEDEVSKLMRAGGSWLAGHPERELITSRYLGHHRTLVASAVSRLAEVDDTEPETLDPRLDEGGPAEHDVVDRPTPLVRLRRAAVVAALRAEGASTVVDLGCGEGALLRELLPDPGFARVLGVDVSHRALELASRRLQLDRMPDSQRARLELVQSSATYRDDRLANFDAIVLMEVIEHLDPGRLPALVRSVFARARPTSVLVTTPNAEHNVRYPDLPAGAMRHRDHRFEWTRQQFREWADTTATAHGYTVRYEPIGDDPEVGPPTQMAIFRRVG
jgi:3' terminal RNA ribose 2'-O-methyltransferase Hen1